MFTVMNMNCTSSNTYLLERFIIDGYIYNYRLYLFSIDIYK